MSKDYKNMSKEEFDKVLEDPSTKHMETFSLIGTKEQLKKYATDMANIGWKLTYKGNSGHWLGEPIYNIKATEKPKND